MRLADRHAIIESMIIPRKLPKDPNQRAHQVARMLLEGPQPGEIVSEDSKRLAQAGRRGGKKGGKARAENLSRAKRRAIAKKAANTRWSKKVV